MQEDNQSTLSQLHDGFLDHAQLHDAADLLVKDRDARLKLQRYGVISACLSGRGSLPESAFADHVMAGVASAEMEPGEATVTPIRPRASRRPAITRWSALAATFVFGSLLTLALSPTLAPEQNVASAGALRSATQWPADAQAAATLDQLLQVHGQVSFGRHEGTGFLPYAPALVTPASGDQP